MTAACTDGYVPPSEGVDETGTDVVDAGADVSESDGRSDKDTSEEASTDDGDAAEADRGVDTTVDGTEDDGGSNTCSVEGDGTISRDEVPLRSGLTALFRVAQDVEVDTQGTEQDGRRHWDFDKRYDGDETRAVELRPMEGQWFKPDFPEADYAMKLTGEDEELGVFQITEDALLMLGVVSPDDEGTTTNIEYDPPVKVLDFPLEEGKSWTTETTAEGTHKTWSPYAEITYEETYSNQVDARGTLATPHSDFEVLRVRTVLERESSYSGVSLATVRTFAFVTECFGTVATVRSEDGESEEEFDRAAELRRLTK